MAVPVIQQSNALQDRYLDLLGLYERHGSHVIRGVEIQLPWRVLDGLAARALGTSVGISRFPTAMTRPASGAVQSADCCNALAPVECINHVSELGVGDAIAHELTARRRRHHKVSGTRRRERRSHVERQMQVALEAPRDLVGGQDARRDESLFGL